jgi:hypothetical protein
MNSIKDETLEEKIFQALKEINIDPLTLGSYLKEKLAEDRNINDLQKSVLSKTDYYERKATLTQVEYFTLIITKNKP